MFKKLINNTISQKDDKKFMQRCIEIAQNAQQKVLSNPCVGALIVHNNRIIGEGAHERFGEAHAEVNAFKNVKPEQEILLSQSTLYVTLEPCFHTGKTPPCVQLILAKKIPRVVIACIDPFEKVAGQSIALLRQLGVEVVTGILQKEAEDIIRPFLTNIKKYRPHIILKYAKSQDGFIGQKDKQVWLTNSFSKHLTHRWRSECDAILIGTNTALIDNPSLTNRLYFGKNPIRVLIDDKNITPKVSSIFDGKAETLVFTSKFRQNTDFVTYIQVDFDKNLLTTILKILFEQNIGKLIVEGGAKTLQGFIDQNLWDEARVFTAPVLLHEGIAAPTLRSYQRGGKNQIAEDLLEIFYPKKN